MRTVCAALTGCLLFTGTGCWSSTGDGASGSPGVKAQDAATNYAQAIRGSTLAIRSALREEGGLETAKGNTESLLEALEGYEANADAKPHKATYDEIVKLGKELKALFDSSAPPQQIQQKINELTAAAEKLPGTGSDPGASAPQNNT